MHGFHSHGGHSATPVICRTACRLKLNFTAVMGSAVRAVCGSEAKGVLGFSRGVDLAPSISWSAKDKPLMEFTSKLGFSSPIVLVRGKRRVFLKFTDRMGFAPLLFWRVAEDISSMGFILSVVTPRPT